MTVTFNFRYSTEVTADELKARVLQILDHHQVDYDIEWTLFRFAIFNPCGCIWSMLHVRPFAMSQVLKQNYRPVAALPMVVSLHKQGRDPEELGLLNATIHQVNEHVDVADFRTLSGNL